MIVVHKNPDSRLDSTQGNNRRLHLSASPIVEYTISTGLTGGIAAAGAFVTSVTKVTNTSAFVSAIKYTQHKQFLLPVQSSVWTRGNAFNFLGDWRYLHYPQDTYGIGGYTTVANRSTITYQYIRFYEFALKKIWRYVYAGLGYQGDFHWHVQQLDVPQGTVTDFQQYGFGNHFVSSGLAVDIVYDSRRNSVNPEGGSMYVNLEFLQNGTLLGSTSDYNSITLDFRKYISIGRSSVLAFWFYSVLGLSGKAPYVDLPGTGSDPYNNTGRGYEQGRYIGQKYADVESEFRFPISRNGLLGGVVFCNAASVSELYSREFKTIYPGIGAGLRIKFNKFSNTSACLDYGIGTKGSRGFSGNLGEVF